MLENGGSTGAVHGSHGSDASCLQYRDVKRCGCLSTTTHNGYYVKLEKSIERAVEIARTQAGAVVNLLRMIETNDGQKADDEAIVNRLIRNGRLPRRINFSAIKWKIENEQQTVFHR